MPTNDPDASHRTEPDPSVRPPEAKSSTARPAAFADPAAFDPHAAFAALAALEPPARGRRLSFVEQCGLWCAAAKWGHARDMRPAVVAKAFGVTRATVSLIANCNERHYPGVAAEIERLGVEAFRQEYYTRDVHERLFAAKAQIGLPAPRPSHATADKYAGRVVAFDVPPPNKPAHYVVAWADRLDPPGWRFAACTPAGTLFPDPDSDYWFGANETVGQESEPFRTSALAFDAIHIMMGEPSPRPRPGRPSTGFRPGRPKGGSSANNTARILGKPLK